MRHITFSASSTVLLSLSFVCVIIPHVLLSLEPRQSKIHFQAGHLLSVRDIHVDVLGHRGFAAKELMVGVWLKDGSAF